MAVVVQQMVVPQAAGILFTADPVTSSRKVASVEASFGLGEALVSGLVNADTFKVRDGEVVARVAAKHAVRLTGREEAGSRRPTAGAHRRAGRAARAAGPADRSAFRPPAGHRMVPGRRRLLDRPEPADHDAVPDPRGRRPREPRVRLSRSWADDDRGDEAPGGLRVAADGDGADARGRWQAVRRRHPTTGFADDSGRSPRGSGERRPADRGRAADHPRTRRLPPLAPGRGPGRAAGLGRARSRSTPIRRSSPS